MNAQVVENMFASDVAFLQDFYRQVNAEDTALMREARTVAIETSSDRWLILWFTSDSLSPVPFVCVTSAFTVAR
jgi:hypothetical protein